MIDSTNNNGTNGLATALKDRSSCTIPVQPNRSLPVRPAPHIPCRSILSKRLTKKSETDLIQSETTNNTQSTKQMPTTSTSSVELSSEFIDSQSSSSSLSRTTNHAGLIRINVPNWQNEIRLPIINIIEVSNSETINEKASIIKGRLNTKKRMSADNGNYGINNSNKNINYNFIDISKSPERCHDYSTNGDSSPSNCTKNDPLHDDNDNDKGINGLTKRRKKKDKKVPKNNVNTLKIVPPLRLKKIQCLQENNSTNCLTDNWSYVPESINVSESEELTTDAGFRYYQPSLSPKEQIIQDDTPPSAHDWPNEYKIINGQTPPYPINLHNESLIDAVYDEKNLHYHQRKLEVKLRELKKKTFELSREVINTAFTSPNNSIQETIDSYKKQIETLKNLLQKLPQTGMNNITIQIPESSIPSSTIVSSSPLMTSIDNKLTSTYCESPQSPGPPQLSPNIEIDSVITKNPKVMRNSPPSLSKINLVNDDVYDRWTESEFSKKSSKNNYEKSCSARVTTTSECIIDEEIDIDDKPELLDLSLNEIMKSDMNSKIISQNHTVKKIETDGVIRETCNNSKSMFTNSDEIIINTTNSEIEECTNRNEQITSPKITSSCDTSSDNKITTVQTAENNLMIDNQFPSLRSWLANSFSAKNIEHLTSNILEIEEPKKLIASENQLPSVIRQTMNFNQTHKLNTPTGNSRINKSVSEQNAHIDESHWNNVQWQNHTQRQTNISQNSTSNNINASIGTQQFCPPVPLAEIYARNYPMDSRGPYNYNHPSIVATANTASTTSIWNSAILEYPHIRSQNISNAQLSEIKTNTNFPQQRATPVSTTNSVALQNTAPPLYHHFSTSTSSQGDIAKMMSFNDPTNTKLPLTNFSVRNNYLPSSPLHSIIFPASSNTTSNQRLHPLPSQENFYYYHPQAYLQRQAQQQQQQQQPLRYAGGFNESPNRFPIHDRPITQLSYRPPWRCPLPSSTPFFPGKNYGMRSSWPLDPCNLLSSLSPAPLQNYTTTLNLGLPMSMRGGKERVTQTRNCDTPHLGKVEYSPNTSRTLECSNCGRPNPTFKCLGCEMTFYCDESCQARHWTRHVVSCPKKMPKLKKVVP